MIIIHPVVFQLLEVAERGQGTLAAEAVEPPEYDQVELLLVSLKQQLLEFGAVGLTTRLLVSVHLIESTMLLSKGTQLVQLVFGILTFVFS